MEMINVLNVIPATRGDLVLFLLSVVLLCMVGFAISFTINERQWGVLIFVSCLGIIGFIGIFLGITWRTPEMYKCTIKEGTNCLQFLDKYDIISVEGSIYTVRLKEIK